MKKRQLEETKYLIKQLLDEAGRMSLGRVSPSRDSVGANAPVATAGNDEFMRITFMKPTDDVGKGKKKGTQKNIETTETLAFEDMESMLSAIEQIKSKAKNKGSSTWQPQKPVLGGLSEKENNRVVEAIQSRIKAMGSRKGGAHAQVLAISALESDKDLPKQLLNLGVPGSETGPVEGNSYSIPDSLKKLAEYKVEGAAGTAIGRGEFVAILMFGDESGAKEPDIIIPDDKGGKGWSVKESQSASMTWEPSAGDPVKTWALKRGSELYNALDKIWTEIGIADRARKKDPIAVRTVEILEAADIFVAEGNKRKSYTLNDIEKLCNLGDFLDDLRQEEQTVINEIYTLAKAIFDEWDKQIISKHSVIVFRRMALHALYPKDLFISRIQDGRAPKIGWAGSR